MKVACEGSSGDWWIHATPKENPLSEKPEGKDSKLM